MKNKGTITKIGLIALVAIIAFAFTACNNGNDLCNTCGEYPCACNNGNDLCDTCGQNPCVSFTIFGTFELEIEGVIYPNTTVTFTGNTWTTSINRPKLPSGKFTISCNKIALEVTAFGAVCPYCSGVGCEDEIPIGYIWEWTIINANRINIGGLNYYVKKP